MSHIYLQLEKYGINEHQLNALEEGYPHSLIKAVDSKTNQQLIARVENRKLISDSESSDLEFRVLQRCSHIQIAAYLDLIITNTHHPIIIREWVHGTNLREWFPKLRSDPDLLLDTTFQICMVLSNIHQSGLIHGRLKPENIILDWKDDSVQVKLTDYGLSDLFWPWETPDQDLPASRQMYKYLSPETIFSHPLDPRADIYSLGVILAEIILGEHPFEHASIKNVIGAQLNRYVEIPRELCRDYPSEFICIIHQMLAKERHFRPNTTLELLPLLGTRNNSIPPPLALPPSKGIFVGQHKARRKFQEAFQNACNGNGSIFFVLGSEGTGKSRLIHESISGFRISGADVIQSDFADDPPDGSDNFSIVQTLLESISSVHPRIPSDFIDDLYRRDEDSTLTSHNTTDQQWTRIKRAASKFLQSFMATGNAPMTRPLVISLINFHAADAVLWNFLCELSQLW